MSQKTEKEAREYCHGSPHYLFEHRAYIAGATAEHERAQQELQAYRDIIKELLPLAEGCYYFHKNEGSPEEFLSDIHARISMARKLIDTVTPT